jgi:hypothetical protein
MGPAPLLGEGLEGRLEHLDVFVVAAEHEAVPSLESPNPAAHSGVDEPNSLVREHLLSSDRFAEVGVAAVDHEIPRVE